MLDLEASPCAFCGRITKKCRGKGSPIEWARVCPLCMLASHPSCIREASSERAFDTLFENEQCELQDMVRDPFVQVHQAMGSCFCNWCMGLLAANTLE